LQNSLLESSCVVVAFRENYSSSNPLKVIPEKLHILSCDTVVANERYVVEVEVAWVAQRLRVALCVVLTW
jgi:hypothetical protein